MPVRPERPNFDHLKKQAKDLIRLFRARDTSAAKRFARSLPAAAGRTLDEVFALDLNLHDAQSCVARDYGFASWLALGAHVEASVFARDASGDRLRGWLDLVYGGDVTGRLDAARPRVAAEILRAYPDLLLNDALAACAVGDIEGVARALAADDSWRDQVSGPLSLPPLVAVTHSRLGHLADFREGLRACAKMLLDAGADPNDGESLYHSLENPDCTHLLLARGARVAGTNALRRALDMAEPAALELVLAHGGNPNEPAGPGPVSTWGAPLLRAIALRCSIDHVAALLAAGADPRAQTTDGVGAYSLACQTGSAAVAALLAEAGAAEELSEAELFVAACARADGVAARRIQARRPDLPASLPPYRLRLLPDTVAWGSDAAAWTMVELGWPIDARGGDWNATALNLAVFRGDASMTTFLLAHGADRRERQGFGDDVLGTLSWASINEPSVASAPDWAACARALMAHEPLTASPDPSAEHLIVDGRRRRFAPEVTDALLSRETAHGTGAS